MWSPTTNRTVVITCKITSTDWFGKGYGPGKAGEPSWDRFLLQPQEKPTQREAEPSALWSNCEQKDSPHGTEKVRTSLRRVGNELDYKWEHWGKGSGSDPQCALKRRSLQHGLWRGEGCCEGTMWRKKVLHTDQIRLSGFLINLNKTYFKKSIHFHKPVK